MLKRIISFLVCLVIIVSMFFVPSAKAVTPADALIASALISYVGSAGVRLWRDGVGSGGDAVDQMVSDLKTVWGDLYVAEDSSRPSWSSIAGISVTNGKFILDHDTAQTFQGFANWLGSHYQMIPYHTYDIEAGGSEPEVYDLYTIGDTSGLTRLIAGKWQLPVVAGPAYGEVFNGAREKVIYNFGAVGSVSAFMVSNESFVDYVFCSKTPFSGSKKRLTLNLNTNEWEETQNQSLSSSLVNVNNLPVYYYLESRSDSNAMGFPLNSCNSDLQWCAYEMAYVFLYGTRVTEGGSEGSSLLATVGASILDNVYDLLNDQSVAVDIGAAAGADEEDLIAIVSEDYIAGEIDVPISQPITYPVAIEGVSELYPQPLVEDVDALGLPALGQALTTRFPFCIPWDVVYLYQSLSASPERPVFEIDLLPANFKQKIGITADTSFTFDLGDPKFALAVKIVRWSTLFGFVLCLALTTKRLIWTTGG